MVEYKKLWENTADCAKIAVVIGYAGFALWFPFSETAHHYFPENQTITQYTGAIGPGIK